jgi:hypothetical protein
LELQRVTARPRQIGVIQAMLIALVLAVQTVGSAYAIGAGSGPILLDAFGNPLCITSGEHGGAGDGDGHGGLKDCCALACASAAAIGAAPQDAAETGEPAARLLVVLGAREFAPPSASTAFSQGYPRAPPSA